jgi:hypothetical protein
MPANQIECSVDGKAWYYTTWISANTTKLTVAIAGTAWDISTLGTPINITCTDGTYVNNNTANYYGFPVIHTDGSFTLLPGMNAATYKIHSTWTADVALSRNINISSFSLASAPTNAWLKLPNVSVATANAAGRISSFAKELHLDTGTAATTTVAVVGADTANTLATGDTVLLNGTTSVTLSNVVEVSNGLAKQDPGNTTDYIQYNSKSFNTSISNGFVRFSRDGSKMYVAGTGSNGAGIYLYTLSTPNDVTTATWDNKNYVLFSGINNGSQTSFNGFDIHPDGNSLVVFFSSGDGAYAATIDVRMFTMSRKHDLLSMTFTTNKTISHSDGNYAAHPRFGRFNKNGTQVYFSLTTYNVNYSIYMYYMTLTTPYDLATAGSTSNLYLQLSTGYQYGYTDGCFSPDGALYVSGGYSAVDGWLFTKTPTTANLITSVPLGALNNDATIAINWPAASGVTTSTAITGFDFAWDSTKFYVMNSTGTIYQFNVRVKALNKYTITYPTQASAPTSVYLPDRSTQLSLTTNVSNGNIVQTSAYTSTNSRAVQFKLTNNPIDCEVTQVRLNLRKT